MPYREGTSSFNNASTSMHSPGSLNTLSGICPGICVRALYTRICSPYRFFSTSDIPVRGIDIDIRDTKLRVLADDRDGADDGLAVNRAPYPDV